MSEFNEMIGDTAQADMKLIITASRAAGWERDRNAYPSHGDDIAAFLAKSKAQVKVLREGLERCMRSLGYYLDFHRKPQKDYCGVESIVLAKNALVSTGEEPLEKDLAEAERVLWFFNLHEETVEGSQTFCLSCFQDKMKEGHEENCEYITLKKEWEAKRDSIKGALEGLKWNSTI